MLSSKISIYRLNGNANAVINQALVMGNGRKQIKLMNTPCINHIAIVRGYSNIYYHPLVLVFEVRPISKKLYCQVLFI